MLGKYTTHFQITYGSKKKSQGNKKNTSNNEKKDISKFVSCNASSGEREFYSTKTHSYRSGLR